MNRLWLVLMVAGMLGVGGCQTAPVPHASLWQTHWQHDEFDDVTTRTVSARMTFGAFAAWRNLDLVICNRTNELSIGVRSEAGIPVGTVQIRVDTNETFTISPDETPLYLFPKPPRTSGPNADAATNSFVEIGKLLSPYTAATGDKARAILKQMVAGQVVIYRTIGFNQEASSPGRIPIDHSFTNALHWAGIDPVAF